MYTEEQVQRGKPKPLGEGILIFDEVKVTGKVKWSSKSNKFYGLEMTKDEFPYLDDIYETLDPEYKPKPAQYMLQFLWRDLTSDFDVVGPYYSTHESFDHKFIISCVMETMRIFHAYDFLVVGLVCDGASPNLAAIKLLCTGKRGVFGKQNNVQNGHSVKAWFYSFFTPNLKVFCCICPSHQLKNQINALYASRTGGTKCFQLTRGSTPFGWSAINGLWNREKERAESNLLRKVPRLKERDVNRDAWTKLAVQPAKIMQVCHL